MDSRAIFRMDVGSHIDLDRFVRWMERWTDREIRMLIKPHAKVLIWHPRPLDLPEILAEAHIKKPCGKLQKAGA